MYAESNPGSLIWIEHLSDGDVYTRVKLVLERQPSSIEICRNCRRGQLSLYGHLIRRGFLDDVVYAVARCEKCCGLTVFEYHLEQGTFALPEMKVCDDD